MALSLDPETTQAPAPMADAMADTLKYRAAGPDSHFAPHAHRRPGDCRTA